MCVRMIRLRRMPLVFSGKESEQTSGLSGVRFTWASC